MKGIFTPPSSLRRFNRWPIAIVLVTAALTLGACGEDNGGTGPRAAGGDGAAEAEVVIDRFSFMPESIDVTAGTTVTWTNQDSAAHSIEDEGGLFPESESFAEGEEFSFTYDAPGDYPYICGIHTYMTGTVTVS